MPTNVGADLAVQSFCFRGFETNAQVAEKVKEIGLNKIEVCQKHVNFGDVAQHKPALQAYKDAGVGIVSIGVQGFANEPSVEENFFKFAQLAGLEFMACDFRLQGIPDNWKVADELAEKYGVKLAIHNHGSKHWLGSVQALKFVLGKTSSRIGLCLDTAWALHAREDPIAMAKQFADRLYGVHFKDFVFDEKTNHKDVVVGTGQLQLKELLKVMKDNGFAGYAALEYEGDVSNPVPALTDCVKAVRAAWAGL